MKYTVLSASLLLPCMLMGMEVPEKSLVEKKNENSLLYDLLELEGRLKTQKITPEQVARRIKPVHLAAASGDLVAVEYFAGFEKPRRTAEKWTPLHFAAQGGHAKVIESLINQGYKVNDSAMHGLTSLHIAAMHNHEQAALCLLKNGAQVDARSAAQWTPLHYAAAVGSNALVKALISQGANRALAGPSGMTAFHIAVLQGNYDACIALYYEESLLEASLEDGRTPMHLAAQYNQVHMLKWLIETQKLQQKAIRTDNDQNGYEGYTPLHFAAENGSLEAIEYLHQQGAGLDDQNGKGNTPLHCAIESAADALSQGGDEKVKAKLNAVKLLLTLGAKKSIKNASDLTPLHLIGQVLNGRDLLDLYCKHELAIDKNWSIDEFIATPLHLTPALFAAREESVQSVEGFHKYGADFQRAPIEKSSLIDGVTALSRLAEITQNARKKNFLKLVDTLTKPVHGVTNMLSMPDMNNRCPIIPTIMTAAQFGFTKLLIEYLKKAEVRAGNKTLSFVNFPDSDGNTPLHRAVIGGRTATVRALLWYPYTDTLRKNYENKTARDLAISLKNQPVIDEFDTYDHQIKLLWGFAELDKQSKKRALELKLEETILPNKTGWLPTDLKKLILVHTKIEREEISQNPASTKRMWEPTEKPNLPLLPLS